MLQEVVSLNIQMVDGLVHSLDPALRRANQVLVRDDLIDQLLLGQLAEDTLRIRFLILPFLEIDCKRMVQAIQNESRILFDSLARLDPLSPLVHGFGQDVVHSRFQE